MSTLEEIGQALEIAGTQKMVLLHCTSTYPARPHELNLKCIQTLRERYGLLVGYSGHEVGLYPSALAVGLGACVIERHITLDRAMWGSDQAASIEPQGLQRLIRDIRETPVVMGTGEKVVYEAERAVREKLRRYSDGGRREEDIKPVRV
jgi:N-acetylneuraminate synthase